MRRRALIVSLSAALAGALAGCAAEGTRDAPVPGAMPEPSGSPSPSPSAVPSPSASTGGSPFGSTRRSTLAAQTPQPVAVPAGSAPGTRFGVGTRTFTWEHASREVPTTIWYPATSDGEETPIADGRFPIVLFSHGLTAQPRDYRDLLTRWTRAGFVVAGVRYPHTSYQAEDYRPADIVNQPADASYVIGKLIELDTASDPFAGRLATDRIAAAGHSGGGITTVGLFTGSRDARLTAGVVLAGTDLFGVPFTGPPAPMLFVHGRRDNTVAYAAGRTVYQAVPWSRALLTVTNGGHLNNGGDLEAIALTSTDFLRWSLYGDTAARARLAADAKTGGVATLTDEL